MVPRNRMHDAVLAMIERLRLRQDASDHEIALEVARRGTDVVATYRLARDVLANRTA